MLYNMSCFFEKRLGGYNEKRDLVEEFYRLIT